MDKTPTWPNKIPAQENSSDDQPNRQDSQDTLSPTKRSVREILNEITEDEQDRRSWRSNSNELQATWSLSTCSSEDDGSKSPQKNAKNCWKWVINTSTCNDNEVDRENESSQQGVQSNNYLKQPSKVSFHSHYDYDKFSCSRMFPFERRQVTQVIEEDKKPEDKTMSNSCNQVQCDVSKTKCNTAIIEAEDERVVSRRTLAYVPRSKSCQGNESEISRSFETDSSKSHTMIGLDSTKHQISESKIAIRYKNNDDEIKIKKDQKAMESIHAPALETNFVQKSKDTDNKMYLDFERISQCHPLVEKLENSDDPEVLSWQLKQICEMNQIYYNTHIASSSNEKELEKMKKEKENIDNLTLTNITARQVPTIQNSKYPKVLLIKLEDVVEDYTKHTASEIEILEQNFWPSLIREDSSCLSLCSSVIDPLESAGNPMNALHCQASLRENKTEIDDVTTITDDLECQNRLNPTLESAPCTLVENLNAHSDYLIQIPVEDTNTAPAVDSLNRSLSPEIGTLMIDERLLVPKVIMEIDSEKEEDDGDGIILMSNRQHGGLDPVQKLEEVVVSVTDKLIYASKQIKKKNQSCNICHRHYINIGSFNRHIAACQKKMQKKENKKRMKPNSIVTICYICNTDCQSIEGLQEHIYKHTQLEHQEAFVRNKTSKNLMEQNIENDKSMEPPNQNGDNQKESQGERSEEAEQKSNKPNEKKDASYAVENDKQKSSIQDSLVATNQVEQPLSLIGNPVHPIPTFEEIRKKACFDLKVCKETVRTICECHVHHDPRYSRDLHIEIVVFCKICRIHFRRRECFEIHFRNSPECQSNRKSGEPKLFCRACSFDMCRLPDVRAHLEQHAIVETHRKTTFICTVCKIVFIGVGNLFYNHWHSHNKDANFIASRHTFSKASIVEMATQNQIHIIEEFADFLHVAEFVCKTCRLFFVSEEELSDHNCLGCLPKNVPMISTGIPITYNAPITPVTYNAPITPVTYNAPITPNTPVTYNAPNTPVTYNAPITPNTPITYNAPITPNTPNTPVTYNALSIPITFNAPNIPVTVTTINNAANFSAFNLPFSLQLTYDIFCTMCNLHFKSKYDFDQHSNFWGHVPKRPPLFTTSPTYDNLHIFTCNLCGETKMSFKTIQDHWVTHYPVIESFSCFSCSTCNDTTFEEVETHCKHYHKSTKIWCAVSYRDPPIACVVCKSGFSTEDMLRSHINMHHKTGAISQSKKQKRSTARPVILPRTSHPKPTVSLLSQTSLIDDDVSIILDSTKGVPSPSGTANKELVNEPEVVTICDSDDAPQEVCQNISEVTAEATVQPTGTEITAQTTSTEITPEVVEEADKTSRETPTEPSQSEDARPTLKLRVKNLAELQDPNVRIVNTDTLQRDPNTETQNPNASSSKGFQNDNHRNWQQYNAGGYNLQTPSLQVFICDLCPVNVSFNSHESLIEHTMKDHIHLVCKICWIHFSTTEILNQHLQEFHSIKLL